MTQTRNIKHLRWLSQETLPVFFSITKGLHPWPGTKHVQVFRPLLALTDHYDVPTFTTTRSEDHQPKEAELRRILFKCLKVDPKARPTASELLSYQIFECVMLKKKERTEICLKEFTSNSSVSRAVRRASCAKNNSLFFD